MTHPRATPNLSVPAGSVKTGGPLGRLNGPFNRSGCPQAGADHRELSVPPGSVEIGGAPGGTGAFDRHRGSR